METPIGTLSDAPALAVGSLVLLEQDRTGRIHALGDKWSIVEPLDPQPFEQYRVIQTENLRPASLVVMAPDPRFIKYDYGVQPAVEELQAIPPPRPDPPPCRCQTYFTDPFKLQLPIDLTPEEAKAMEQDMWSRVEKLSWDQLNRGLAPGHPNHLFSPAEQQQQAQTMQMFEKIRRDYEARALAEKAATLSEWVSIGPVKPRCDCGAEVARTTHSDWCSTGKGRVGG